VVGNAVGSCIGGVAPAVFCHVPISNGSLNYGIAAAGMELGETEAGFAEQQPARGLPVSQWRVRRTPRCLGVRRFQCMGVTLRKSSGFGVESRQRSHFGDRTLKWIVRTSYGI
jgi:hypothetical protein